ncbi:GNAT family N-acetyltransferase [Yinghuangia sp. ASG 101]|uniref:GNAT family N-acetyltransferase n=1 Tax=Yinghuangia sp. ASG 101 TaxID=2896848 RepID=UPI001E420055|nr:GNAT family N-acetyltransferase [Yinghuangia sp. ASG 101]UGQ09351.1 GNAT family N-acetyltransferase [Yinghuangia sp. ASG 101]
MALWRVRAQVDDDPGRLARLAAVLAAHDTNVLALNVQACAAGPVDEFFVHAPASVPASRLADGLIAAGGRDVVTRAADAHELVDSPTKALVLAARLRDHPDTLPQALVELLDADGAAWVDAKGSLTGVRTDDTDVLYVPVPDGRAVRVGRAGMPFTMTEAARAAALARLVVSGAPVPPPASTGMWLLLSDGTEVLLRPGRADDVDEVQDMHDRCSAESRRLRYFTAIPRLPRPALERLLVPRAGVTLVAVRPEGGIAAVGSLMHTNDPGSGELALLVEDAWQGRGLGTAMLRRLGSLARARGMAELRAHVLPGNGRMLGVFDRAGLTGRRRFAEGVVRVSVPVVPSTVPGRCA